ncbi:TerD family protein [Agitococcus lubricus]|uniref:Stress response protein SCP2 n=1 Tax=Agitococcus lubricus TaxID=1077255 RepID=A0A2T5J2L3_9GAMM|nr:TerD family protein [Agitococcus lubricus]PTQ90756.1 stress response protein SCP2 [Agitococcus lubricus]
MAVSLKKGEGLSLRKSENDLTQVTIGLGWDIAQSAQKKGFFGSLFAAKPAEFDLDAVAFLLDKNGKVASLGAKQDLIGGDVVFFNSKQHPSGHIWLTGDNRTGAGDGDDEQIVVKLNQLGTQYQRILFVVSIYQGQQRNQHFGQVANAFIRAVDSKGKELCRFNISAESHYDHMCSMTFAEVVREADGWQFRALGTPNASDSFVEILKQYL